MTGRRQSSGERVFTQILTKVLKFKQGKSYNFGHYKGHVMSRAILGTGDFYKNCIWNILPSKPLEIDFCFRKERLAVEIDGGYHLLPEQKAKDISRDLLMRNLGWTVVRIPDHCVNNTFSWLLVDKNYILS